ncbi:MAG: DUF5701 family protein [Carbonactinosporaceae bacterium]
MVVPASGSSVDRRGEFDRQVDNLLDKNYPGTAGLSDEVFLQRIAPLRERLSEPSTGADDARIAFVVVMAGALVPPHEAISLVELRGKRGFTTMEGDDLKRFTPIEGLAPPPGSAYLLTDIDTGAATRNVTPDEAITTIASENRSPLTIDEGVALVTQYPEVLRTRNAFSLLGSRCGDRRVPALWVSRGSPRLGWCWAGNPHTWLGSASCGGRVGGWFGG